MRELLLERRAAIAGRWLDKTIQTYPPDAAAFLKRQKDRFANPVGHALSTGLPALLDAVLADAEPPALRALLEPILRIRSVQSFSASQAVAFVFLLKGAAREELPAEQTDLSWLHARVDQLALHAFDIFTRCREEVHEVRVNDVKRRVSGLMRRLGIGLDDLEARPLIPASELTRPPSQGNAEP